MKKILSILALVFTLFIAGCSLTANTDTTTTTAAGTTTTAPTSTGIDTIITEPVTITFWARIWWN